MAWFAAFHHWLGCQWTQEAIESLRACTGTAFWTLIMTVWCKLGVKELTCCKTRCCMQLNSQIFLFCDFQGSDSTVTQVRWTKWNHRSVAYRRSNKWTKNYCNRTIYVQVIVKDVVTCFFLGGAWCRLISLINPTALLLNQTAITGKQQIAQTS